MRNDAYKQAVGGFLVDGGCGDKDGLAALIVTISTVDEDRMKMWVEIEGGSRAMGEAEASATQGFAVGDSARGLAVKARDGAQEHRAHGRAELWLTCHQEAKLNRQGQNELADRDEWHDVIIEVKGELVRVAVDGPSVRDIAEVFAKSWRAGGGKALPLPARAIERQGPHADAAVSIVQHDGLRDRNIEREIVQRINASTRIVRIANPFAMSEAIQNAIVGARMRGVRVQWIWGRQFGNAEAVMSLSTIRRMLGWGVEVYEYPTKIHAKIVVCDDMHTIMGSSNLDGSATWLNDEASLQISSRLFAAETVVRIFAPDITISKRLT